MWCVSLLNTSVVMWSVSKKRKQLETFGQRLFCDDKKMDFVGWLPSGRVKSGKPTGKRLWPVQALNCLIRDDRRLVSLMTT
jgi:hypothetical protein